MFDVQRHQLGTAQGAGETGEQQRTVAQARRVGAAGVGELANFRRRQRG